MSNDDDNTITTLIREANPGQETVFDLLDQGGESVRTIEVRRRDLAPELPQVVAEPNHKENPARRHSFHDVDAFCDYLKAEPKLTDVLILADVDARTLTAVLNETSCETDREKLTLQAIEHPLFTPWKQLLKGCTEVIDFSLFCMRNRRAIVEPNGRDVALVFQQVKMSKQVEVNAGVGTKAINGVMCQVSIAGEVKNELMELPETIAIEVPLFLGTSPQRIEIDLTITGQSGGVFVFATASDVEAQQVAAFEEMVEKIKSADIPGATVGLGCVQHRDWDRLEHTE